MGKTKMMVSIALVLMLLMTCAFGTSDNSVDRVPYVKIDTKMTPSSNYSSISIQEKMAGEFVGDNTVLLILNKGEWFETGKPDSDPAGPDQIKALSQMSSGATISVNKLSGKTLSVVLNRGTVPSSEKAWWRIPMFVNMNEDGRVEVTIDSMDSPVSYGTYTIGKAVDTSGSAGGVSPGHVFSRADASWVNVSELNAGETTGMAQTFQLQLTNGAWIDDVSSIQKDSVLSGVESLKVVSVKRLAPEILEVTVERGAQSSTLAKAVWSIPLYFKVLGDGDVKVQFKPMGSKLSKATVAEKPINEPIRYVTELNMSMDNRIMQFKKNGKTEQKEMHSAPKNLSGVTYVPLRGIFESMGADVQWNFQTQVAQLKYEGKNIEVPLNSKEIRVDGKTSYMDTPAQIIGDRLYIPLRAVSEQLGFDVQWDAVKQQITIIKQ